MSSFGSSFIYMLCKLGISPKLGCIPERSRLLAGKVNHPRLLIVGYLCFAASAGCIVDSVCYTTFFEFTKAEQYAVTIQTDFICDGIDTFTICLEQYDACTVHDRCLDCSRSHERFQKFSILCGYCDWFCLCHTCSLPTQV